MRGGLRLGVAIWAAGIALAAAPLAAQSAPETATNAPAADAIGPRELQNFSLSGTVTRPADQPPQRAATPPPRTESRAPAASAEAAPQPDRSPKPASGPVRTAATEAPPPTARAPEPLRQSTPASSVTVALPSVDSSSGHGSSVAPTAAGFVPESASAASTLAPEQGPVLWPWLLAAIALGAGGAFLFWRGRSREAFAGGPQIDLFKVPEAPSAPAPPPTAPEPAPPVAAPPVPSGLVSTRLRPWLEVAMIPVRCIVEETQVIFEFELDLFNSGNAPARAVLVEASVFNASPTQEQDIAAFFAKPIGEGERIDSIPPLQRMTLTTQVVAPRENVQVLDVGERQVFVPLIAFNALYRWSAGEGQTSVSYLLGRDTKGEKMAPFRLDLGPRVFRGVGARQLPTGVRS